MGLYLRSRRRPSIPYTGIGQTMYHLLSAKNDPRTGSPYRFHTIVDILRKSGEGLEPFGIRRSSLMPENGYLIFNRDVGICGTKPLYPRGTQLRCFWVDLFHAWSQEERRLESLRQKLNARAERKQNQSKLWNFASRYGINPSQLSFDVETLRIGDWPFPTSTGRPIDQKVCKSIIETLQETNVFEPVVGRLICNESNLKEETKVAPKNAKKAKFYTASREIGLAFANGGHHPHMHEEIEGALKEAEASLNNNPTLDAVCVVQIVRVVRRAKAPIKVEIVK